MSQPSPPSRPSPWRRALAGLRWTRSSYLLLSGLIATVFVVIVVWWPLVQSTLAYLDPSRSLWQQLDWLLVGIFAVMSLLIMGGADLKTDGLVILVGTFGGLVIESWGTQTQLWTYFTQERPPLWIIPAWPIASLAIDRLVRILRQTVPEHPRAFRLLYWGIFVAFYALMLSFTWPTLDKSFTLMALLTCALLILSPTDERLAVLTFIAGSGLGYFLERWGTTRACWIYYTKETPPFFAVVAHGLAAVAFWRAGLLLKSAWRRYVAPRCQTVWAAGRKKPKVDEPREPACAS